jgi:hypothetical protein
MPVDIKAIVDKCFILAPVLSNKLGVAIANAVKRVCSGEMGADAELLRLYAQVPATIKAHI